MEIAPNVHLVPGMRGANVYLLVGSKLTLVDGGMPGSEKAVYGCIESLGWDASDLHCIVLTHHHLDHVAAWRPSRNVVQHSCWPIPATPL